MTDNSHIYQTKKRKKMTLIHLTGRQKAGILAGALISMLLAALDQTIVGTALPHIAVDLKGSSELAWVVSAYLVASAVSVPIMSKLSDIYGRRTLYFVNIGLFLLGSMLCGLSTSMTQLIAFRALQGLGGGFLLASAFTIIGDIFPPRERGKWQGLVGGVFGIASVVGPTLGGFLTDNYTWRWVFYVNLPVGVIAVIALLLTLPNIKRDVAGKIDYLGSLFLVVFVVPLLIGLLQAKTHSIGSIGSFYWWSAPQLALFAASLFGIVAFILRERVAPDPIIPLRLFKNKNFSLSSGIVFITAGALFGGVVYIPIFVQSVIGQSATNSGLILMPLMAGVVVASIVTGQLTSRTGKYKILGLVGLLFITLAMTLLAQIKVTTSNGTIITDMVLLGLGLGVTFPLFTLISQNEFGSHEIGVVTGCVTFFRTMGGAIGTAVIATRYNSDLAAQVGKIPTGHIPAKVISVISNPNVFENPKITDAIYAKLPLFFKHEFNNYLYQTKIALSYAIAHVYNIGILLGLTGFVLMIFITETPLKTTHGPAQVVE
jgi:EmrB/QacA subfamily drug resistance transporter